MLETQWEHRLINMAGNNPSDTLGIQSSSRTVFSYWAGDATLGKAYQLCSKVASHHSKSFFMASALLPEEKRTAVRALYAFCRTVDDIVDEGTIVGRNVELDYWRGLNHEGHSPRADDLIGKAWVDTRIRYHIPTNYALQLIDGVSRDLVQNRYQTFDDLTTYCYSVASTVGLMSMYIVGFKTSEAVQYAIKLGVALQMTNILRDVGEDSRNGRIYLPQEEIQAYGISETDLVEGKINTKWREFMKFQLARTRQLYAESAMGIKLLERDGQLAIGAASNFYKGILDVIEDNDYDVFSRRASLGTWGKLSRIPALLMNKVG